MSKLKSDLKTQDTTISNHGRSSQKVLEHPRQKSEPEDPPTPQIRRI